MCVCAHWYGGGYVFVCVHSSVFGDVCVLRQWFRWLLRVGSAVFWNGYVRTVSHLYVHACMCVVVFFFFFTVLRISSPAPTHLHLHTSTLPFTCSFYISSSFTCHPYLHTSLSPSLPLLPSLGVTAAAVVGTRRARALCCSVLLFIMANGTKLLSSCHTHTYKSHTHTFTEERGWN